MFDKIYSSLSRPCRRFLQKNRLYWLLVSHRPSLLKNGYIDKLNLCNSVLMTYIPLVVRPIFFQSIFNARLSSPALFFSTGL
jgi:hypothetical protein